MEDHEKLEKISGREISTTQTGIPIIDCEECGYRHPITRPKRTEHITSECKVRPTMTELDLTPIKDRLAKARHLPVFLTEGDIAKARENRKSLYRWHLEGTWDDAVLFGRARDDIAALLAEVERLREGIYEITAERYTKHDYAQEMHVENTRLHAQLDAVRELHYPVEIEPSDTICGECSYQLPNGRYLVKVVEYPCPTIRALWR